MNSLTIKNSSAQIPHEILHHQNFISWALQRGRKDTHTHINTHTWRNTSCEEKKIHFYFLKKITASFIQNLTCLFCTREQASNTNCLLWYTHQRQFSELSLGLLHLPQALNSAQYSLYVKSFNKHRSSTMKPRLVYGRVRRDEGPCPQELTSRSSGQARGRCSKTHV